MQVMILIAVEGTDGVFTFKRPAAHYELVMPLINHYFGIGYKYKEILTALTVLHGIKLSLRHLKRLIHALNLSRLVPDSRIDDIIRGILQELSGSGQCIGYKTMWKRLKLKYRLNVRRSTVIQLMWLADPVGMERRKKRRLLRRQYSCPGPNFVWHIDGYDKIKPFGFAIHGAIDGFSRRIMWLAVETSNNDPKLIARYFLQTVTDLGFIVPTLIRSDKGTENCIVRQLQILFRKDHNDHHSAGGSFIMGKSTSNQRIESLWAILRRQCLDFWINLFKYMRDTVLYNDGDIFHRQCLIYCFLPVISCDLREFVNQWNLHDISSGVRKDGPCGKPEVLFTMPELQNSSSYHYNVDQTDVNICKTMYTRPMSTSGCLPEFLTLFDLLCPNRRNNIENAEDAFGLYIEIISFIQLIFEN
jgi:hypothetical protein